MSLCYFVYRLILEYEVTIMTNDVIIARYDFPHEAQLAKMTLEASDIAAWLKDENFIRMDWFYSQALGGVKVLVSEQNAKLAKEILSKDFSDTLENINENFQDDCSKNETTKNSIEKEKDTRKKFCFYIIFYHALFYALYFGYGLI